MFEVNCNITYKYLRVYTMSADVDFQVQNEFCIKALYITKHTVLNGFRLRKVIGIQHTIHTIHVLELKKIFTQKKIKEILKHELFTYFFLSIELFLSLSRTWKTH